MFRYIFFILLVLFYFLSVSRSRRTEGFIFTCEVFERTCKVPEYFYWIKSFPSKTHFQKWKLNEDCFIGKESWFCLHTLLISGEAVSEWRGLIID